MASSSSSQYNLFDLYETPAEVASYMLKVVHHAVVEHSSRGWFPEVVMDLGAGTGNLVIPFLSDPSLKRVYLVEGSTNPETLNVFNPRIVKWREAFPDILFQHIKANFFQHITEISNVADFKVGEKCQVIFVMNPSFGHVQDSFEAASKIMPVGSYLGMIHPSSYMSAIELQGEKSAWMTSLNMVFLKQHGIGNQSYSGMKKKMTADMISVFVKLQAADLVPVSALESPLTDEKKQRMLGLIENLKQKSEGWVLARYKIYIAAFRLYAEILTLKSHARISDKEAQNFVLQVLFPNYNFLTGSSDAPVFLGLLREIGVDIDWLRQLVDNSRTKPILGTKSQELKVFLRIFKATVVLPSQNLIDLDFEAALDPLPSTDQDLFVAILEIIRDSKIVTPQSLNNAAKYLQLKGITFTTETTEEPPSPDISFHLVGDAEAENFWAFIQNIKIQAISDFLQGSAEIPRLHEFAIFGEVLPAGAEIASGSAVSLPESTTTAEIHAEVGQQGEFPEGVNPIAGSISQVGEEAKEVESRSTVEIGEEPAQVVETREEPRVAVRIPEVGNEFKGAVEIFIGGDFALRESTTTAQIGEQHDEVPVEESENPPGKREVVATASTESTSSPVPVEESEIPPGKREVLATASTDFTSSPLRELPSGKKRPRVDHVEHIEPPVIPKRAKVHVEEEDDENLVKKLKDSGEKKSKKVRKDMQKKVTEIKANLYCSACHQLIAVNSKFYACESCRATYHRKTACLEKLVTPVGKASAPKGIGKVQKVFLYIQQGHACKTCSSIQSIGMVCKVCKLLQCMDCFAKSLKKQSQDDMHADEEENQEEEEHDDEEEESDSNSTLTK